MLFETVMAYIFEISCRMSTWCCNGIILWVSVVGDGMWDLLVSVGQVLGFRETKLAKVSGSGGAS